MIMPRMTTLGRGGACLIVTLGLLAAACARQPEPVATPTPVPGTAAPVALDRSVRPHLGPAKPLSLPPVITRMLRNGLRILVVEHHELPVADVVLVAKTGVEADPPLRAGLATLV